MNAYIHEEIRQRVADLEAGVKSYIKQAARLGAYEVLLRSVPECSDTLQVNSFGGVLWFDVYNREDLEKLFTLAPLWSKESEDDVIAYSAIVEDTTVKIRAHSGALPPTCKLVEEDVVIPATPERVEKRLVVKCNQPVAPELDTEPAPTVTKSEPTE